MLPFFLTICAMMMMQCNLDYMIAMISNSADTLFCSFKSTLVLFFLLHKGVLQFVYSICANSRCFFLYKKRMIKIVIRQGYEDFKKCCKMYAKKNSLTSLASFELVYLISTAAAVCKYLMPFAYRAG